MKWIKLDHAGASWGYCGNDDVIRMWVYQDRGLGGWKIRNENNQVTAETYGSRDTAQKVASEMWGE